MSEWLLSFLVHSSLWCSIVWLWLRLRPQTHATIRETLWYTAISASLITPTVQTFTSPEAAFWQISIPQLVAESAEGHLGREPRHEENADRTPLRVGEESHGNLIAVAPNWKGIVATIWISIATILILWYVIRLEWLRRRLRNRETVNDPRASRALAALSRQADLSSRPLLTECDRLGSPIALGLGTRREICVPVRALNELDDGELSALLGHEIAHHLRRDAIRLGILNTIQAVFFFQPFFRLAVHELHCAAEEQCDDWSASQLEDPYAMASCLTEVAGWVVRQDRHIPVPCMGRRRSQLEHRVHRLMDDHRSPLQLSMAWRRLSFLVLIGLTVCFAPAMTQLDSAADFDHDSGEPVRNALPEREREHELREHRRRSEHRDRREHQEFPERRRREHGH